MVPPSTPRVLIHQLQSIPMTVISPSRREDWPVADIVLGKMNHDFEAAYAIWSFFKNKKR
jgi:hypothetical protein